MRKWSPLIAICLGTLMLLIDVTIVNVALPAMAGGLGASFSSLQWVIDMYALALAALLLAAGTIADRVGHRVAYLVGLTLFAAASLASGCAQTGAWLISARGVQGIGGAIMFATTFALLNSSYSGRDRGTAYGVWGAVSGAAAAIGPIVGGLLVEHLSWRWIFLVNLPVSLLAIVMVLRSIRSDAGDRSARFDLGGVVSFTVFAAALTYGLIRGGEGAWTEAATIALLVLAALALGVFAGIEARSSHPLIDLELLRHRVFTASLIAGFFLNLAAFANLAYTAIWLQSILGLSPVEAGLATAPMAVAAFATSGFVGRFVHGAPVHLTIGGGVVLIGLGELVVAWQLHTTAGWPALITGLTIVGIGVGLAIPVLSSAAMAAVDPRKGGMAAGAVNTARQIGLAIGIAALGALFSSSINSHLTGSPASSAHLAQAVAGGRLHATDLPAHVALVVEDAAAHGITMTYVAAGIVALAAGAAVSLMLYRSGGDAPAADRSDAESAAAR